ncbi:MAG: hypothetical protein GX434_07655 [Peptococcaceae bacterium]|nr:hypothetical protein [Peptococcaceae bacterium]
MKNPIICFMGLDGSGKSTSINYAYEQLKIRGFKVEIVRAAYVVKVMSFFIKLGKKILMKRNSNPYSGDYKNYLESLRKQSQKKGVYKIFSFLTTCEFKVQIFFNVRLKHMLGSVLLIDRYIYDNAVTYAANLGLDKDYMAKTISGKWKHAPRPDLIIYIKTPVEVCCSRKDDIPDPLYLQIREPLYDAISKMYPTVIISGNQDKQVMLDQVMGVINPLLEK